MRRDVSSGVGSKRRLRICSMVESGRVDRLEAVGRVRSSIFFFNPVSLQLVLSR